MGKKQKNVVDFSHLVIHLKDVRASTEHLCQTLSEVLKHLTIFNTKILVNTCNPYTSEAETEGGGLLRNLRPAWTTKSSIPLWTSKILTLKQKRRYLKMPGLCMNVLLEL